MPSLAFLTACLLLLLQSPSSWIVSAAEDEHAEHGDMYDTAICQCSLTTFPSNEAGCRVYGYHLDHLMPWYPVDLRCLQELDLLGDEIEVSQVALMCPAANGTNADVTGIADAFREDTPIGNFLKSQYNEYFTMNNETGNYEWLPTIQSENNGQTVDCSGDAAFCYQVLTIYLTQSDQAATEVAFICGEVHKRFREYATEKQSEARELLCASVPNGGVNTSSLCYPLYEQIYSHADASGNVDCTGIGNGPEGQTLPPVCDGPVEAPATVDDESSAFFVSAAVALLPMFAYFMS